MSSTYLNMLNMFVDVGRNFSNTFSITVSPYRISIYQYENHYIINLKFLTLTNTPNNDFLAWTTVCNFESDKLRVYV